MTNPPPKIGDKAYLIDQVLFLNGITRAGKFLLGKLVSGLETVEHFQYVSLLEHLPFLTRLGFMQEDAAIALMHITVDEHAYNSAIGRNLNFRVSDASSLYNVPHFDRYLLRSLTDNNQELIDNFKKENSLPSFIIHESLPDIHLFFKAFPQLKIIDLQRHPIDLVYSWFKRGWGHRQGEDGLSFAPVLKGNHGGPIPWHAESWKNEYGDLEPIDRIIKSIHFLVESGEKAYQQLSKDQQKKILRITYENLVENTTTTIENISSFMQLPIRKSLPIVMQREEVPNKLRPEVQKNKLHEIEKTASKNTLELLYNLSQQYEANF